MPFETIYAHLAYLPLQTISEALKTTSKRKNIAIFMATREDWFSCVFLCYLVRN